MLSVSWVTVHPHSSWRASTPTPLASASSTWLLLGSFQPSSFLTHFYRLNSQLLCKACQTLLSAFSPSYNPAEICSPRNIFRKLEDDLPSEHSCYRVVLSAQEGWNCFSYSIKWQGRRCCFLRSRKGLESLRRSFSCSWRIFLSGSTGMGRCWRPLGAHQDILALLSLNEEFHRQMDSGRPSEGIY